MRTRELFIHFLTVIWSHGTCTSIAYLVQLLTQKRQSDSGETSAVSPPADVDVAASAEVNSINAPSVVLSEDKSGPEAQTSVKIITTTTEDGLVDSIITTNTEDGLVDSMITTNTEDGLVDSIIITNTEDGLVDINLMLTVFSVGKRVKFHDADAGDDVWLPAVVTKIEYKAISETDSRQVPHYELELVGQEEMIEDVLAFDLQSATEEVPDPAPKHDVYDKGEQVEFYFEDFAIHTWVAAVVIDVQFRLMDGTTTETGEGETIPYYTLKLVKSQKFIENVLGDVIREDITSMMVPTYEKGDEVEFHFEDDDTWIAAWVVQVVYKDFSQTDHRHVPFYRLKLKENGEFIKNVLGDQLRFDIAQFPIFAAGEKVEYLAEETPGEQAWVPVVVKKMEFKEIGQNNRSVPHYDIEIISSAELVEDVLGDTLREDVSQMMSPVYQMGEQVEFREEGGAWLPAIVEQVGYVTISETDQRLVPWYNLVIDNEFVKHSFGDQLRRLVSSSNLHERPHFLKSGQQALGHLGRSGRRLSLDGSLAQFTHAQHHEDGFTVGDRVEVLYKHSWQPGVVSGVTQSATGTAYSVWYDHMSSDKDIAQARVRGIFGQLGVRVSVLDNEGNSKRGIVAGWDPLAGSSQTGNYNSYHILTNRNAPLQVMQSSPQDVVPFRHEFKQYETVEMLMKDQDGRQHWQRATVEDVDKDTVTYTLKVGSKTWQQHGDFIRPFFMVGNFVWILQHSVTSQKKLRVLRWVLGVLISIKPVANATESADNVQGQQYEYSVWRLDRASVDEGNIITVSTPQLIIDRNLQAFLGPL